MVFSSFVFLLVFFLVVMAFYFLVPGRIKNVVLLLASLLFYAWGEPIYVSIMLFSTVFDYTNGRLIEKFKKENRRTAAKVTLIIDMAGNLGILGFFKYADFVLENVNAITGAGIELLHIALPIGISFYTFQTMSYTIDVYRGQVPAARNILDFATYVTLFPQLIAGPIVQYKTIEKELASRKTTADDFAEGAWRFVIGMAKKVILANQIGALFTTISGMSEISTATAWLGAIAYSFQIYFDFSGYSDMAIGLGRMFGFHFLENFNYPYISSSITEFWRRWHISLSSWFREYVYIPLGGNRKGLKRQLLNITIVWMLTGLWHGASWNFVLWGVYYGILLMIEKIFLLKWLEKIPKVFRHIYCLFLVIIGWTIFAQTDFAVLGDYLQIMAGIGAVLVDDTFFYYLSCNAVLLVILCLCSVDYKPLLAKNKKISTFMQSSAYDVVRAVIMIVLMAVCFGFLVGDSYNPFLYFRF
ncbi:MAG: MBOAT family O-acyltransferase [Agathobacter sp.]